jgi:hypothetical protein
VRKEGIKRYYVVRKEGKDEKTDKRRNTVDITQVLMNQAKGDKIMGWIVSG